MERGIGDVLLAWENEAYLALGEAKDKVDIIVPSVSILAEPSVAVVDKVVDRRGTRAVARAYLEYLYSPEGQEIAARNHYRPRDQKVAAKYAGTFAKVKLFTIDQAFGGWDSAQKTHFADGGTFDQIYRPGEPLALWCSCQNVGSMTRHVTSRCALLVLTCAPAAAQAQTAKPGAEAGRAARALD